MKVRINIFDENISKDIIVYFIWIGEINYNVEDVWYCGPVIFRKGEHWKSRVSVYSGAEFLKYFPSFQFILETANK